ncbi:MAG: iron-containing alcohol dehydrogenase [Chloroflexota bacterium]
MRFEFATAARIIYGAGVASQAGALAAELGRRAFVVTGSHPERAAPLLSRLAESGLASVTFSVPGEPMMETAREGTALARQAGCDLVVGFGGGSALDAGKAIAALLANGGDPMDYAEVVGRGRKLTRPSLPYIAIPTTAGTGAEVTKNAVLASPEHRVKASLRSPFLLPTIALVDPELTYGLPPEATASSGLDALTQLIEPFLTSKANPLTDVLCRDGMMRVARSLRRAYENGHDAQARQDMALASLFGGLALANAGLGAVHAIAGPFGGMFPAPHGASCAALLPAAMEVNVRAARQRQPGGQFLQRCDEVAGLLTGRPEARAEDGVAWLRALCRALNIRPLSEYGMTEADLSDLIDRAKKTSSMKANPILLTDDEIGEIVRLSM